MKAVILASDKAVRRFESVSAAAEFLGVGVPTVSIAIKNGYLIKGEWKAIEKTAEIFRPKYDPSLGLHVKEIFTRKPYSSTNMWREKR